MNDFQNISATSIVALFQTSKEERKTFVNQVVESVINGNKKALDIHLQLKAMEDIIEQIKADLSYKETLLNEAELNGKSFEYQNAKIDIREVGTKYDFSLCNDPMYSRLKESSIKANDDLKEREKFLKSIPQKNITNIDTETGEATEIYPPSKSSTTSVVVTMK